jgi:hypothetical protein
MNVLSKVAAVAMALVTCCACSAAGSPYLPVNLKPYATGAYESSLVFQPDVAQAGAEETVQVAGVPVALSRNPNGSWRGVDVGLSKWRSMAEDEQTLSFYPKWCQASAQNGDLVLHLPKGLYFRAYVLAASVPQADRDPALTLRSGAFQNRGYLADVTVEVPALNTGDEARVATSIPGQFVGKDGKPFKGKLSLVPIRLPAGSLLKLLEAAGEPSDSALDARLDVQLTGRLHVKVSAPDPANFSVMPLGLPSGAQVYGITFERSPVSLSVDGASTWNIFPHLARPAVNLELENLTDRPREVILTAKWGRSGRDAQGNPFCTNWELTLGPGEKKALKHEPTADEYGVYDYAVALADSDLGELLEHRTSFARLPQFRAAPLQAGLRSRFCVWWWNGTHYTLGGNAGLDPVDWLGLGYVAIFTPDPKKPDAYKERGIRGYFDDAALCMHEFFLSGPHCMRYPSMMLNEPRYKLTEAEERRFKEQWEANVQLCQKTRSETPDKKIILGNSTFESVEEFLYRKFPADLFDALGHEACGLMRMPERQPELATLQEVYWFKRALKEYGYDKPVTGCHEWLYHSTNPGNHTHQAQADIYVRDMLHGLAYGFDRICPAAMEDVGGGYYWANWGASGLVTRSPDVHPKLSYVAYAVAAHQLSDADFVRAVPTGSHSAYCLEFDRRRGDKVLACWTLRGRRQMTIEPGRGSSMLLFHKVLRTDQQGNRVSLPRRRGAVSLEISPSPVFVENFAGYRHVTLGPPSYAGPPPTRNTAISALSSLHGWRLVPEPNADLDNGNFDMPRQKGEFDVTVEQDTEKGPCVQFSLRNPGSRPPWIPSYQALSAEQPIRIPGKPTAI